MSDRIINCVFCSFTYSEEYAWKKFFCFSPVPEHSKLKKKLFKRITKYFFSIFLVLKSIFLMLQTTLCW